MTKASWKPLIVVCLAMLSLYFLASGINVVVAKVYQDLKTNVGTIQLALVLASLVSGSLMVTAGKLGDKIGKKKTLIIGLIIFLIGAIIALISPNASVFILAWGLIWPLGMGVIVPTTVAMVTYFYEGNQRASAFGIYGAAASLAVTLGPLIVGFMADAMSWRLAMVVSPVLTIITLILAFTIEETEKNEKVKIDIPAVLLSFFGLAIFLISMLLGGTYGFFMEKRPFTPGDIALNLGGVSIVIPLILISVLLIYLFVQRNLSLIAKGEEPLLDPSIFKNSIFRSGLIAQTILYLVIPAIAFMLPLFLQSINQYSPSETALAMLPGTATLSLVALLSPSLGQKVAPKFIVIAGFAIAIVGTFLITGGIKEEVGVIQLTLPLIVYGVGAGLVIAQIANLTLSAVEPSQVGEASGLVETSKEAIGGGFGIAIISTIVLGMWYGNFVDQQTSAENRALSDGEKQELVLKLEEQINDGKTVETSTYYKALPPQIQAKFNQLDYAAGRDAISQTIWVVRVFLVLAMFFSLTLPSSKLE
jgi:MFS family permease